MPRLLEEGVTATWGAVEERYSSFYSGDSVYIGHNTLRPRRGKQ